MLTGHCMYVRKNIRGGHVTAVDVSYNSYSGYLLQFQSQFCTEVVRTRSGSSSSSSRC